MKKCNKVKITKGKGDDAMSVMVKPRTGAFVLDDAKSEKFLSQKSSNAKKAIDRFMARKPKENIVNSFKK